MKNKVIKKNVKKINKTKLRGSGIVFLLDLLERESSKAKSLFSPSMAPLATNLLNLQNPCILFEMGKTTNGAMEARPEPTDQVYIDKNIRHLRRRQGWSQEELGARIGLNRGNIASYENGTAEPKICNLLKMAQLFGVSILDITHRDMSQDTAPDGVLGGDVPSIEASLQRYVRQAQELQAVMKGLHTCCRFKVKNMEEASPRDLHVVAMHFEELFHTAQTLLEGHLQLLQQLGAPCQTPGKDE